MEDDALAKLLLDSFVEELEGHQRALARDARRLEMATDAERSELLRQLFRTVHTIKGAARAAAVSAVEGASHRIEDLLQRLAEGRAVLEPSHVERFIAYGDLLERAQEALAERGTLQGAAVFGDLERFGQDDVPSEPPTHERVDDEQEFEREPPSVERSDETLSAETNLVDHDLEGSSVDDWEDGGRRVPENVDESERRRAREEETLRLPLARANAMLSLAADLEQRLARAMATAVPLAEDTIADPAVGRLLLELRRAGTTSHALLDALKRVRCRPFADACRGLDRFAREAARKAGRDVELVVRNAHVELDREIVGALKEVLVQLVRNAIDHGCESPEERVRAGKTPRATIEVSVRPRAGDLVVSVSDDGRGFDVEGLRRELARKGDPTATTGTDDEVVQAAFLPGLSTSSALTDLSGRGVGLDIVRARIEDLRGSVAVSQRSERGARVSLFVPVLRSSVRVLLVKAGTRVVALPTTMVETIRRVARDELVMVGGRWSIRTARGPVGIASLGTLVFPNDPPTEPTGERVTVILLGSHGRTAAVAVDALVDEREILVTALPPRLSGARLVTGVTTLVDGQLALALHGGELIERARRSVLHDSVVGRGESVRVRKPVVLLADDSLTTRTLEKSILSSAGYDVVTASDGEEAWELLRSMSVDAVVSDVEMPRLDGFELTARIRRSERLRMLPILLVTGRASDEDRRRGLDAGANGYIVKRAFDQEHLLEALRRLV